MVRRNQKTKKMKWWSHKITKKNRVQTTTRRAKAGKKKKRKKITKIRKLLITRVACVFWSLCSIPALQILGFNRESKLYDRVQYRRRRWVLKENEKSLQIIGLKLVHFLVLVAKSSRPRYVRAVASNSTWLCVWNSIISAKSLALLTTITLTDTFGGDSPLVSAARGPSEHVRRCCDGTVEVIILL